MILQAETLQRTTGRVTDAERRALRGHAPLAMCLPPDRLDLAWVLERRLFDHGHAVHVIRDPESLRQAVRTAMAAGLIAIVVPVGPADWDVIRHTVPAEQRVRVENLQEGMEAVARVSRSESSLTGGDGI
jgi:hypothetical protein